MVTFDSSVAAPDRAAVAGAVRYVATIRRSSSPDGRSGGGAGVRKYRGRSPTATDPADPEQEQRPVHLHAVVDIAYAEVTETASATARMHPTFELAQFPRSGGLVDRYLIHYPEAYYRDATVLHPTLVFLHGWGHVTNVSAEVPVTELLRSSGLLERYEERARSVVDQPFIVIAPHCDDDHDSCWGWIGATAMVESALDHARTQLRAPLDGGRLYVTGVSTGGEGAWRLAMDLERVPDHEGHHRVAASVPIASTFTPDAPVAGYFVDRVCDASAVAIWAFHAAADQLQSVKNDENMVDAYNRCPSPRKTAVLSKGDWTFQGQTHAGWDEAYGDTHGFVNDGQSSIFSWLLMFARP